MPSGPTLSGNGVPKMWEDPSLLKVVVFIPHDRLDTYQHCVRYLYPFGSLLREGLIDHPVIATFEEVHSEPRTMGVMSKCDIIYNRAPGDGRTTRLLMQAQQGGKRVVADLDDDFWRVDPLNPSYKHMGTEEVWAERKADGQARKIWENGVNGFDAERNRRIVDMVEFSLAQADLVTTTTTRLADRLRKINPKVVAIPNPVDLDQWDTPPERPGFRVGWMGGDSHARDVELIIEPLARFLARHDDAVFVSVGANLPAFKRLPKDRWKHHEWVGQEAYPYYIQWMGLDVGLAPILRTEFNGAKSPLKWEEYGAMGIPTLATDYPPYSDYIVHGEDGLLVPDDGWEAALERAYDAEERVRLGGAARRRVRLEFSSKVVGHQWYDALTTLRDTPRFKVRESSETIPFLGGMARFGT